MPNTKKSFMISMLNITNNTEKPEKCAHTEYCGGCDHQGMDYAVQLRLKNDEVERLLKEKNIKCNEYLGIAGSPDLERYRNKMEYTFGDFTKGGEMTLGMHKKNNYMSVITVDECRLVDEDFNRILKATLEFCIKKEYSFYNKKSHKGLLRHLIIRKGERTREILVNIVTSEDGVFHAGEYTELILKLKLNNGIVGIINTVNGRRADAVNCDKLNVLQGRDYYFEQIGDLNFKVSPFSFFQTNTAAAERLFTEALTMAGGLQGKTVFDLYCGTGTISQIAAGKAKKVIGIELNPESVLSARENAALNGTSNCDFFAGDVFEVMGKLDQKPDVIILDPPRAGVPPKALDKIISYGAERIIYISCNPKTFVENLYYLQYYGYKADVIKAYDNFPFTKHCECAASLRKETI